MSQMPDKLLGTDAFYRRLYAEAQDKGFFAVTRLENREPHIVFSPNALPPLGEQTMMMRDLSLGLNNHLHHDGKWVMVAVDPRLDIENLFAPTRLYAQLLMIWFDHRGDAQFTVELEGQLWQQLSGGINLWIERAEEGWQRWHFMMHKVLQPKPNQQYERALGEIAPTERERGVPQQAIRAVIE